MLIMEVHEFGLKHLETFAQDLPKTKEGVEDRLYSLKLMYEHANEDQKKQILDIRDIIKKHYQDYQRELLKRHHVGGMYQD